MTEINDYSSDLANKLRIEPIQEASKAPDETEPSFNEKVSDWLKQNDGISEYDTICDDDYTRNYSNTVPANTHPSKKESGLSCIILVSCILFLPVLMILIIFKLPNQNLKYIGCVLLCFAAIILFLTFKNLSNDRNTDEKVPTRMVECVSECYQAESENLQL